MIILSKINSNNYNNTASNGSYLNGIILSIDPYVPPGYNDADINTSLTSSHRISLYLYSYDMRVNHRFFIRIFSYYLSNYFFD